MSVNKIEDKDAQDASELPVKPLTRNFSNARMADLADAATCISKKVCDNKSHNGWTNPIPQEAPGAKAAVGHNSENSFPLSIFPIATDKFCICFCGLPGRGKTHISRRLAKYLSFFHAVSVELFNVSEYRRKTCGAMKDAVWFDPKNKEAW
jgi:6-phosphofructo-2-kinase